MPALRPLAPRFFFSTTTLASRRGARALSDAFLRDCWNGALDGARKASASIFAP